MSAFAALTALLAFTPAAASAAPTLTFTQATHEEPIVYRGDQRVTYLVTVKNNGPDATTGTAGVSLQPPPGVKFGFGSGSGWSCQQPASVCTNASTLAAGQSLPLLTISAWIYPDAPESITTHFSTFGGGAFAAVAHDTLLLAPAKPFAILDLMARAEDEATVEYTTAGGHPWTAFSSLAVPTKTIPRVPIASSQPYPGVEPVEDPRDIDFELPAGLIGNLMAVPSICTYAQVKEVQCPESAAVGGLDIDVAGEEDVAQRSPLYRIIPEDGYIAAFAVDPSVTELVYVIRVKLRSNGDYGVSTSTSLPPQSAQIVSVGEARLCNYGAKASPPLSGTTLFLGCKTRAEGNPLPFLSNPTRCAGDPPTTRAHVSSYQNPGRRNAEGFADLSDPNWKSAAVASPSGTDCEALTVAWTGSQMPSFGFQPDSGRADAAAGYTANLHIPQDGLTDPDGVANSHLKDTVVRLPEGLALNPSAADGLSACSLDDAGYRGNDFPAPNRIRFTTAAPGCPQSSKVGTAVVTTPVLADPLPGAVYLAAQKANPFGSDFAVYLVIDDPKTGVKATLPGNVETDPVTGRITTTFVDNPQAPVDDVELKFFSGSRASLANPDVCGDYPVSSELSPWSAADPYAPTADELATPGDTITVDTPASDGSACPATKAQRPFDIGLSAGMVDAKAGSYSPFALRMTRPGGSQEFDTVEVSTPEGLVAKLAGVPYCSEQAIQRAMDRTATGDGKLEQADPSCPEASRVGTTTIGAGAGDSPIFVKGDVYLAGRYKGAPISLAFVVPAVAGPFDLGVQVVRTALNVDRKTAKVTAVSDGIPQILRGVPVRVRDIRVDLDRPDFTLNPSDCAEQRVVAKIHGNSGAIADTARRSQAHDCPSLRFRPRLALRLTGRRQVRTGRHPGVRAHVNQTGVGEAGIEKAVVRLPKSLALDPENAQALCEFAEGTKDDLENHCPKGSIVGRARAITPLLDDPLVGNVYFVKNIRIDKNTGNEIRTLPMIVVALRGQIAINLYGKSSTTKGGKLVNTFADVPDAPISRFNLNIKGGKRGILAVTRTRRAKINLCAGRHIAEADTDGQNGRRHDFDVRMKTPCTKRQTKNAKRAAKRAAKARNAQRG